MNPIQIQLVGNHIGSGRYVFAAAVVVVASYTCNALTLDLDTAAVDTIQTIPTRHSSRAIVPQRISYEEAQNCIPFRNNVCHVTSLPEQKRTPTPNRFRYESSHIRTSRTSIVRSVKA